MKKQKKKISDNTTNPSSNHYANGEWSHAEPTDETSWNSITRLDNLSARAEECKSRIDVEKMKEKMSTSLEDGGPMHTLTRFCLDSFYAVIKILQDATLMLKQEALVGEKNLRREALPIVIDCEYTIFFQSAAILKNTTTYYQQTKQNMFCAKWDAYLSL